MKVLRELVKAVDDRATSYEIVTQRYEHQGEVYSLKGVEGITRGTYKLDNDKEYVGMVAIMVASQFFEDYCSVAVVYRDEIMELVNSNESINIHNTIVFYRDHVQEFFEGLGLRTIHRS